MILATLNENFKTVEQSSESCKASEVHKLKVIVKVGVSDELNSKAT